MSNDPINPSHYKNSPAHCDCGRQIECIDVARHMHFNIGNAIKYLWRFRDKGGVEDLLKARWYLDDHIKHLEAKIKYQPLVCEHDLYAGECEKCAPKTGKTGGCKI